VYTVLAIFVQMGVGLLICLFSATPCANDGGGVFCRRTVLFQSGVGQCLAGGNDSEL
jgi:hypothetical protein